MESLTLDERKVVCDYLFKKACRLKDAGLEDSKCYPLLMSAYHKLKPNRLLEVAFKLESYYQHAHELFGDMPVNVEIIRDKICVFSQDMRLVESYHLDGDRVIHDRHLHEVDVSSFEAFYRI